MSVKGCGYVCVRESGCVCVVKVCVRIFESQS
jgi:hypothetical protein